MRKRILSMILALAMLLSLLPTTALAKSSESLDHQHDGIIFQPWSDAGSLPGTDDLTDSAGSFYLTDDVTLDEIWTVPTGTVDLCLNGFVIKYESETNDSVIKVPEGATLNLYDCGTTTEHYFSENDGLWVLDDTLDADSADHTVTGGVITGGTGYYDNSSKKTFGGGVYVIDGDATFNMYGGTITGNRADHGGGVYVKGTFNTFNMYGGTVAGNTAAVRGGGVSAYDADAEEPANADPEDPACLAAGTRITMADGTQRPVEELQEGDEIRTFDHETGAVSQAKICFFWHYEQPRTGAFTLGFSDGTSVTVVDAHSFYAQEENKYVTLDAGNVGDYIGHSFYHLDAGKWVTLESVTFKTAPVETYIVATEKHLNCVAEGMLTCEDDIYTALINVFEFDESMKVDAEKKAEDIARWGLWSWNEELGCPQVDFDAHNLQYAPIAIGKGLVTLAYLEELGELCAPLYEAEEQPAPMLLTAAPMPLLSAGLLLGSDLLLGTEQSPTSGITLGGTAVITGNTAGEEGSENNLYLPAGMNVALGTEAAEPADDMSVGVTTETPPTPDNPVSFTTNGTADDAQHFFSDSSKYEVTFDDDDDVLELECATFNITYKDQGGAEFSGTHANGYPTTHTYGTETELEPATKPGYDFGGWFKDLYCRGSALRTIGAYDITDDTTLYTLYAKWIDDTPTYTVPVNGNANSVQVQAEVSGGVASVRAISDAALAKVAGGEAVEIALGGLTQDVRIAAIPTSTVRKIGAQTGMTVTMRDAAVTFDQTAAQEIAAQAGGSNVRLTVDAVQPTTLSAAQQAAVADLDSAVILDISLVSDGKKLCTEEANGFGGGWAMVTLPFTLGEDRLASEYHLYYVDEAGTLQELEAHYDAENQCFLFVIEHFSDYALAYEAFTMPFVDVKTGSYCEDAVFWAARNGITEGKDKTHFAPNAPVTRAEVVTFLWRLAGKPVVNYWMRLDDVREGKSYSEAVRWALATGITKGTDKTHFSPGKTCSRGEFVTLLARYAEAEKQEGSNPFTDVKAGKFYYNSVLWAVDNDITTGRTATTFAPKADCTRGEAVTFLYRWANK